MTHSDFDARPSARDTGTEKTSADTAKEAGKDLRDSATEKAREVRDASVEHVRDRAEGAKHSVADEVGSIGSALRRASDELRSGSPQERTFGQMAGSLADLSDTIRNKDVSEMVNDLGHFARRNPLAFLGGAALLGFAGARMAKASQRDEHDQQSTQSQFAAGTQPTSRPYSSQGTTQRPTSSYGNATTAAGGEK